jgi:hypothetical protein
MGCAFDATWCEFALGNTPEQRFLGTWSDGVLVTEAIVTDDPGQLMDARRKGNLTHDPVRVLG